VIDNGIDDRNVSGCKNSRCILLKSNYYKCIHQERRVKV
jgi:hypothetical protein